MLAIAHTTAPTPDDGEEAGTPGDLRKGGLEVRVGKAPIQDDAVE